MAGRVRYLLERKGRYFARVVVPSDLRAAVGKTELRVPLGADRRGALKLLPRAVASLQDTLRSAEATRTAQAAEGPARYPVTPEQLATALYRIRLAQDERLRTESRSWASMEIDGGQAEKLRKASAGQLSDDELAELTEGPMDYFRERKLHDPTIGSTAWRHQARLFAQAELEALRRMAERDEGEFGGSTRNPALNQDLTLPDPSKDAKVSIMGLFDSYVSAKRRLGSGREIEKRWSSVFKDLVLFLGHDDYRKVSTMDFIRWRDSKIGELSPTTISKVYLAAVNTVLNHAKKNLKITENKIADVKQDAGRRVKTREQGFKEAEARKIIATSLDYKPNKNEHPTRTAAKRWIPILLAFSGARVTELTQLRKKDVFEEDGIHAIRISPEAGTVKTGIYREIPLHPQIIELGFLSFVESCPDGPLFYQKAAGQAVSLQRAQITGAKISKWLKDMKVIPDGLQPNHAWRHRFKTIGREAGIQDRVLDAIAGHAPRTQGDNYGDVNLRTRHRAIKRLPKLEI